MKTRGYTAFAARSSRPFLALLLVSWCLVNPVRADNEYRFDLAGEVLSESLIQFSHQSGLAIVFSEPELRSLECEFGQGFYFSRAVTGDEAAALIARRPKW